MCGVIGVWLTTVNEEKLAMVERVFYESQIRGKHATGFSYIQDGVVKTVREPVPVADFFGKHDLSDCINEDGGMYLIGHTRYSTSDIRYNQPISNDRFAVAHNGVISQEDISTWKYKTKTTNDSELVLESFAADSHPLVDFPNASMAVCSLDAKEKSLTCFRNHERPLWYTLMDGAVIFTSTKDIAIRAGLKDPQRADMMQNFVLRDDKMLGFNNKNLYTFHTTYKDWQP